MNPRVFKQKGSKVYRGRFKLSGETSVRDVPLETRYQHVAEAKLRKIVKELEEEAAGLISPRQVRDAAQRSLTEHLSEFIADLEARGRCKKHVKHTRNRLARLFDQNEWRRFRDIDPNGFARWRSGQNDLSAKTCNEYLGHANALLNWCVRNGRLAHNPLASVQKVETRGRETVKRRALSPDELQRLLTISGHRSTAYLLAATTGLRRGEIKALVWEDVTLDAPKPFLTVRASTTKNRRSATIPLVESLASALRQLKARKQAESGPVFRPGVPTTKMLVKDLQAAGIAEFDALGLRIDFHALRHTCSTLFAQFGVSQRVAMELMRHSDPRLTAKTYTDHTALPLFGEIEKLPDFLPSPIASPNSVQTGVFVGKPVQSTENNESSEAPDSEEESQTLAIIGQDWESPRMAERGGFEPPIGLSLYPLSKRAHSTTLPPLLVSDRKVKPTGVE